MKVKVECPCGTRFEFEVEPVHGRMPVPINCPSCGAEATDLANAVIRQQSAAAQPAAIPAVPAFQAPPSAPPPPPAAPPAPAAQPAPAPSTGLRIARSAHAPAPAPAQTSAPAPAAAPADTGSPTCPKHQTEAAVETCKVCGKPMCLKCMEQFGYVCSVYCRQQAAAKRIYIPPYAKQRSVVEGKASAKDSYIIYGVVALVFLMLGLWIWYTWFARSPKVVYTASVPKIDFEKIDFEKIKSSRPPDFYQLIGPNQLLSIKGKQMALMEVSDQKDLWSVPVQTAADTDAINAARAKNEEIKKRTPKVYMPGTHLDMTEYKGLDPLGFESDYIFSNPYVIATTNDIWVTASTRLARFDRLTGARKEVSFAGKIHSVTPSDETILVVSGDPGGRETLTQITLPEGAMQSEEISAPDSPQSVKAPAKSTTPGQPVEQPGKAGSKRAKPAVPTDKIPVDRVKREAAQAQAAADQAAAAQAAAMGDDMSDDEDVMAMFENSRHPFIPAGPNVVQFQTKLLERKVIEHDAMRPKQGTSLVDSGKLTAGKSLEAAQEMLNDMRRQQTGGVEKEDVSVYQVTLHRCLGKDIPDWTGQVTGPPQFFAAKTVDIVAAGKSIYVFDKNNKKLWEGKLTYTMPSHYRTERPPCLETKDALYVADQGVLTRFDLANGNVVWRLDSVGISQIQADVSGNLLVDTTTAGPETITFSQQINLSQKSHSLILKVAPSTGKVIWRQESIGDTCLLSGKFLYVTKRSFAYAALRFEQGPDTAFNLRLLNPSSGSEIWDIKKVNRPVFKAEVQQNWILMQYDDEVVVYKFFSL